MDFFNNVIRDNWILGKYIFIFCYKCFIQSHYFKHIACLYQKQEFFLRHDFTIFSVTFCSFFFLIVIWKFNCSKFIRMCITDISLIRPIRNRLFI